MQRTRPVIGSSGDDPIQFRIAERSFDNTERHHAFACIVRRRGPEVAGTSGRAGAILGVLGFESPFRGHDQYLRTRGVYNNSGWGTTGAPALSQPHEKFLLEPSRKFRFDKAWRSDKRSCGCRGKIAID